MTDVGYKGFRPDELEYQYNPRESVANFSELSKRRGDASRKARASLQSFLNVPYGSSPRQVVDIFPAGKPGGPVLVYIHGGYWRGGSKDENCNFAPTFVERGATVVLVEYDLCPAVTVTEIVKEIRDSIVWVYRNILRYGGNPSKLYLAGHSAGGHLAAMALAHNWETEDLPATLIKGAVVTSGVYDLDMVMHVGVNDEIRMTPELARENSPFNHPPLPICPIIVGVGGAEPDGWRQMSKDFFELCKSNGLKSEYLEIPGANHYTMSEHMADPKSPLARAIFRQMEI
jgi:arylformamidase